MQIAYLILAHKHPSHLAELVSALDDPKNSRFYIHVDKKVANFFDHPALQLILNKKNVSFIEDRVRVNWGGFSLVEATLRLLRKAVEEGGFQYAVLLSGQDFPTKSKRHIESFFESNLGKEFISHVPLPSEEWEMWGTRAMERIENYWAVDALYRLLDSIGAEKYRTPGWRIYAKITRSIYKYVPFLKRRFLPGLTPHGGPNWFAISYNCAAYVCDYLQEHPEYCRYFAHTLCADELFLQTLVLNSPFQNHVVNDALRYTNWERGTSSPRVLTSKDFERIVTSDSLFARKFDNDICPDIVEKIRNHISILD